MILVALFVMSSAGVALNQHIVIIKIIQLYHSLHYFLCVPIINPNKPPLLLWQTQKASVSGQQRIYPRKQEDLCLCLYKLMFKPELKVNSDCISIGKRR